MCGVAGFVHYREARAAETAWLRPVLDRLAHRGPDGEGVWAEGPVAFGHRRLAIIDIEGGAQPMHAADAPLTVTFNGEIYNHAELRTDLAGRGAAFATRSDTETILQAYAADPDGFLPRLNGMFAFGLWDESRRRLLLARDRFGVKPLYWHDDGSTLFFASELRALLAFPGVPVELHPAAVHEYLTWEYVAAPATLLRGIHALRPGERLRLDLDGAPVGPALDRSRPPLEPKWKGTAAEAVEGLRHHLAEAVRRHSISDVPVGAFLSGGVDSSGLVAEMSSAQGAGREVFTLGFDDPSWDERPHARRMARHCGAELREEVLPAGGVDGLEDLVRAMDQPMADVSALPTLQLCRLAARHVKVALSGDGADELFGGYERHSAQVIARRSLDLLPGPLRRGLAAWAETWPQTARKKGPWNQLRRLVMGGRHPVAWRQMRWQAFLTPAHERALYDDGFRAALDGQGADGRNDWTRAALAGERPAESFDSELRLELEGYLPNDILTKVDVMSMACSLEVRVPYLDHELADFALRLPARLKLGGLGRKPLLRRALRGRVPDALLDRPKQGFSMPLRKWIAREWHDAVHGAFDSLPDGLRAEGARGLLEEHRRGRRDHHHVLWALFLLARWNDARDA